MTISTRTVLRAVAVTLLVALVQGFGLAAPAMACACGAIEQLDTEQRINIDGETALVRHDGSTEDILLSFDMRSHAKGAALILPLPAQAELQLGDLDTFDQLQELTRPVVVERKVLRGLDFPTIGGAPDEAGAAPTGAVNVLSQGELGPFTTTQLDSDDSSAVADWLRENGYRVRDDIVTATQPYLDDGWIIAAIQLTPGGQAAGLHGDLQPIRATFPTDEMVYPMRLQAQASHEMPLRIYALAEHRMDLDLGTADPELKFAGPLDPGAITSGSTLHELTEDTPFLTRYDLLVEPEEATDDAHLRPHADDTTYRVEHVVEVDYPWYIRIFVPSWGTFAFWAVVLPVLLLAAGVALLWVRVIRTLRRSRPTP